MHMARKKYYCGFEADIGGKLIGFCKILPKGKKVKITWAVHNYFY